MNFAAGPIGNGVEYLLDLFMDFGGSYFVVFAKVLLSYCDFWRTIFNSIYPQLMIGLWGLFAWWRVGRKLAVFTIVGLGLIFWMSLWKQTMQTLALILASMSFTVGLGVPIGILAAKSRWLRGPINAVLDFMQTMPAFVYLIPVAMLFGLGQVPALLATVVFAMPPAVRFTALAIRQIPTECREAGIAFGCNPWQLLYKVELPLGWPTIMAGINQTLMLSLSMVVISSMIGAGGLGNEILAGIQRLEVSKGFEGGLAVVLLAILLDRLSQGGRKV